MNPLFDDGSGADAQLAAFTAAAARRGLVAMTDLVVTRMAEEAPLVREQPQWFRPAANGTAAFDWSNAATRAAIAAYFVTVVRRYVELGFRRLSCPAALAVPAEVWRLLIAAARDAAPDCVVCADTLGEPAAAVQRLAGVGFDYLYNSVKWWDFRSSWLFDEDHVLRRIAPTIGFPESHDTERLATDLERAGMDASAIAAEYRRRYAFAADFSSGILMPMGFEWGWRRRLDNARTRPTDPVEDKVFDLSPAIAGVNATKAALPALNGSAAPRLLTPPDAPVAAIARASADESEWAFILASRDPVAEQTVPTDVLLAAAEGQYLILDDIPNDFGLELEIASAAAQRCAFCAAGRARRLPCRRPSPTRRASQSSRRRRRASPSRICRRRSTAAVTRSSGSSAIPSRSRPTSCATATTSSRAAILYRRADAPSWREAPMLHVDNDRWGGSFTVTENALLSLHGPRLDRPFRIVARRGRQEACSGPGHRSRADRGARPGDGGGAPRQTARDGDAARLKALLAGLDGADQAAQATLLLSGAAQHLVGRWPDRDGAVTYARELGVIVEREQARFAAWYEMFPRSQGTVPGKGATFDDCIARLPDDRATRLRRPLPRRRSIPIGRINRKGRNNSAERRARRSRQPLRDRLATRAATRPSSRARHVRGFPPLRRGAARAAAWRSRSISRSSARPTIPGSASIPSGSTSGPTARSSMPRTRRRSTRTSSTSTSTARTAPGCGASCCETLLFWIDEGVRIFRVDNPHTKPVPFWEW